MAGTPETPEQRRSREQAAEQTPEPAGAARKRAPRKAAAKTTARTAQVSRARDTGGAPTSQNTESAADEPLILEADGGPSYGRRPGQGETRAVSASAARIDLRDRKLTQGMIRRRQAWQTEAWDYVSEVGEIRYGVNFVGNMMSKLRLFPATRPDMQEGPVSVDDPESGATAEEARICTETLARLRSTQGGQSALLRNNAINYEVAGEGYLHGHEDPETGEEEWSIRSVDELVPQGDDWTLRIAPGSNAFTKVPKDDLVIRMWEPDPRFSGLATCAMRAILSEAESVLLLSRELRASAKSRLNAGMLLVPSELDFGPPGAGEDETNAGTGKFGADLMETIITPIQNEGSAAAVAPWIVRGKSELLKPEVFRHLTFERKNDGDLDQRIEARILRIARGMNLPPETVLGMMQCVDHTTEILTDRGWLTHEAVRVGDLALTVNHDSGLAEWQRIERVSRFPVADQPMLSLEGQSHSSLTTLNHRWPVLSGRGKRRWVESADLKNHHRILSAAPSADLPVEAKYEDAFVELVAWFWTEGAYDRSAGGYLYQSETANPEKVARIRQMLTALCGPAPERLYQASRSRSLCTFEGCDWPVHGHGVCGAHREQNRQGIELRPVRRSSQRPEVSVETPAWRETQGQRSTVRFFLNKLLVDRIRDVMEDVRSKTVSRDFIRSLTRAQLELFIDASTLADGHWNRSGATTLRQAVKSRTDAFEFACILSGRSIRRTELTVRDGFAGPEGSHQWSMYAGQGRPMRLLSMERSEVTYTGTVWCPTLPNGSWFARRDGKVHVTGNTTFANASTIKKAEWDSHGEPRAVMIVDAWTAGYFQPALVEAGMTLERARDFFVWFDPSDAIASPDATDSADLGLEQGLISDDAWRRTKGFAEGDAPDDEERIRRMLFKAGLRDPTLIAELLVITGIAPNIHIPAPAGGVLQPDGSIANAPGQGGPVASTPPVAQLAEVLKRRGGGLSAEWDQLVAALVAAAPKQRRSDLGRKLMEMDRALRIRLLTAADQAMRRAMEKAGNRLKPKLGRSGPTRELAAATHPRLIAATLGRQVVEASGATGDELLDGAFDELAGDFGSWVEVTQADALAALEAQVGQLGSAAREELRAAQRQAVDQAKGQLLQDLQTLAGERLFDPTPGAAAGEADPTLSVPSWVVRKAMSVAGGGDPEGGGGQPLTSEAGGPAFGVATGPDIIGTAVSSGAAVEGYVWDYGSAPRAPFPPHEALDGVAVQYPDDPAWANEDGWPTDQCFPGDHDGCACDITPVLLEQHADDTSSGSPDDAAGGE